MLFSDQRRHALSIPAVNKDGKPVTIAFLIDYLCENTMKDSRKELFVLDGHLYVSKRHRHTRRPDPLHFGGITLLLSYPHPDPALDLARMSASPLFPLSYRIYLPLTLAESLNATLTRPS